MTITAVDRAPTTGERYIRASQTSDLRIKPGRCDADTLLAAGFAAAGNENGTLALGLYRMRATGDRTGFLRMTDLSANWIIGRSIRPGRNMLPRIARIEASDTARAVLQWWLNPTCTACEGRGHPIVPGTARLDDSRECPECHGTGKSLVEHVVQQHLKPHARWLAGEYDGMAGAIFAAMARLLAPRIDL